ncbi:MAG: EFR1 family ferrodoxin [Clostridiales bacterium]|nr:EFR1 family ferrodoxin [Clostridiales bacterium]
MNTCIYTFSGTGTALAIADQIGAALGNATVQLIPRLLQQSPGEIKADAPKTGFVFPNYFGGMPNAVRAFVQKLNLDDVHYCFAIVPAGGGQGYSLKFLQKELLEKGKALDYGRYVKGGSNYIVAGYYKGMTAEKRDSLSRSIREKIHLYTGEIKADKSFVKRSNPLIYAVNRLLSSSSSRDVLKDTSAGDREYSAGSKCTGCGICQKLCQAGNIVMLNKKPSFQHKCYRCMACLQYCPQNAILFSGKELNKQKYNHPDYPAAKMIRQIQA